MLPEQCCLSKLSLKQGKERTLLWEAAEQEAYRAQMLDWQHLLCIPGLLVPSNRVMAGLSGEEWESWGRKRPFKQVHLNG